MINGTMPTGFRVLLTISVLLALAFAFSFLS
jgi:hypothetical protein